MALMISSIVLHGSSQPDFNMLRAKGWEYPDGLRGETLERVLVKSSGELRFQIVRHEFGRQHSTAEYETYTEIYMHHSSDDENKPLLKGHGTPFSTEEMLAGILWLESELEGEYNEE